MRHISNTAMQTLIRHLPRVLKAVRPTDNNRLSESARMLHQTLKQLRRVEKEAKSEEEYHYYINHDETWLVDSEGNRIRKIPRN